MKNSRTKFASVLQKQFNVLDAMRQLLTGSGLKCPSERSKSFPSQFRSLVRDIEAVPQKIVHPDWKCRWRDRCLMGRLQEGENRCWFEKSNKFDVFDNVIVRE